jgi:hypothetical protein
MCFFLRKKHYFCAKYTAMPSYQVTYLPTQVVMSIKASDMQLGIPTAFAKLEMVLPSLKGRHFYGACRCVGTALEYWACVAPFVDTEFELYGLEPFTLPEGKYAYCKLLNWAEQVTKIKHVFMDMENYFAHDSSRPQIEDYRSQNELVLYLPIL